MSKLILMSVLVAIVAIPARAARTSKNSPRGLKRALTQGALFMVFYTFALKYLWGRW